jgi:hypothetical protein
MTDPSARMTRRAQPGLPVPGCPAGAGTTGARTVAVRPRAPFAVPAPGPALPRGRPILHAGRAPARIDAWLRAGRQARPRPGGGDLTGRAESRVDACGPGRQASAPRRPASGPAASTPGNGAGAHEVTARDHPAPAPAGLPLRQGRAARQPRRPTRPRGLSSFPQSRGRPPRADAGRRRPGGGRT